MGIDFVNSINHASFFLYIFNCLELNFSLPRTTYTNPYNNVITKILDEDLVNVINHNFLRTIHSCRCYSTFQLTNYFVFCFCSSSYMVFI